MEREILAALSRVYGAAWFTTGDVLRSDDSVILTLFGGLSGKRAGTILRDLCGQFHGGARLDLGAHNGQHRFRFTTGRKP